MLSTSARLLRLASLLQSRRHWPGRDLAERLGVDARTLRRDIDRLRSLGYPLEASSGRGGGYSLGRGANLPPLTLDDTEAVTLAVALRAASATMAGIEEPARELLAKLDQWLPARVRRRASALHDVTMSVDLSEPLVDANLLATIAAACRDQLQLRFHYRRHDRSESDRKVEPARLINYGRRWYLAAWDCDRDDWRTFRTDRIAGPITIGPAFTSRDAGYDFLAHIRRAVAWSPFDHRITVRLQGGVEELAAAIPEWCGVLVAETAETTLLDVGGESPESLLAHLCIIGRPFELVDGGGSLPDIKAAHARVGAALGC